MRESAPTQILDRTTRIDDTPSGDPAETGEQAELLAAGGKGMTQLVANYRSILDARAIYYPVAYRFTRELGRGRQGVVFLGLRQGARGSVTRHAIKIFDPGIYPNAKKYWTDMGRIAVQTSKLQTVKSPNLVAPDIYEEYNGIGYLQMESIRGVGLRYLLDGSHLERVRQNSRPEEWAGFTDVIFRIKDGKLAIQPGVVIYIMRRVLRALESLHDAGYVHCDVKPANIMIDQLGYVKLIDYGRATLINEKVSFLLGTPVYMAPEMHRREPAMVASDIYTVGLVILEMLRGEVLINRPARSENELMRQKIDLYRRLPELLPDHVRLNDVFMAVLRRFLDPDPARRYANAQEAESGKDGLLAVHKQLAMAGKDTEYGRELENYLSKLINPLTGNLEI
ncbi:MAG TPA: serine/threonine-protein kinase [Kiritimatiellia bacterium]|nr:serine/threonine-protein kinase [Kiritimatiellia bacterium]HMO98972.1 serine/threonine-protein kinase [Kiritimatiellia bacterium]HMP96683.1 serine/threonine-protein kinase [Kiritimatiellia bacterium]